MKTYTMAELGQLQACCVDLESWQLLIVQPPSKKVKFQS